MPSNQGSYSINDVLDDVDSETLDEIARVVRVEVKNHAWHGTCECPAIEALCALYDAGYKIVRE